MLAGSEAQKQFYLPKLASGTIIGCFASAEGPGPVISGCFTTKVESDKLTGSKIPVIDGGVADAAVVLAQERGLPTLYLVDLHGPGVRRVQIETMDPSRKAELCFDEAPVERLGAFGAGLELLTRLRPRGNPPCL